ncbi:hypothetical protein IPA_03655 [Ignicoccus pacificus DSM 13166]|uniref:Uncharacterized protein n=1 Tax=Ignicoccus pacificus DSM 13166 TaxID=940294 RepID=A0A977PKS7_9CREN|nr:hypothetical protein IPA_03655 [Ignicoccus pacificus DSM 13166]
MRQAREHVDRYGSLDSEGRTLVAKAVKLMKRSGIKVDWSKIRAKWDVESVDRLVVLIEEVLDEEC